MNDDNFPNKLLPEQGIILFHELLASGISMHEALLTVIGRWSAKEEIVNDIQFRYWVSGEAFNWELLARRLLLSTNEINSDSALDQLLTEPFVLPGGDQSMITHFFSPQKYKAHLNFLYGVMLEEVIINVNELSAAKEILSQLSHETPLDTTYLNLYAHNYEDFIKLYQYENKLNFEEFSCLYDYQEFLYWSWKYRIRKSTPEKIAYDTQTGISYVWNLSNKK